MYFFCSSIYFRLTTILRSCSLKVKKNIEIDADLLCSYYVLIYLLHNNISIAYFVIRHTIIVKHILFYSLVTLFRIKWMKKKFIFAIVCSTSSIEAQQQLKQKRIFKVCSQQLQRLNEVLSRNRPALANQKAVILLHDNS